MPRQDIYHEAVKHALIKDGWAITHDPFTLTFGRRRGFIDLGAERMLAAEREGRKIAVEVKSFVGVSALADLEQALGQYLLYKSWLARLEPDRALFLALSDAVADDIFGDISAQVLLEDYGIALIRVNMEREEVVGWTNSNTIEIS